MSQSANGDPLTFSHLTSDRTPRPLMASLLNFNLPQEISLLRAEVEYTKGHNARTLVKHSEFRIVVVALKAGATVNQHETDQRIALQPLTGHLRLHVAGEVVNLHADQLLSLDRNQPYSIEAVDDCAFLLWVGWSKG
jgi:quercetin dioxygenase-like cupin family protein